MSMCSTCMQALRVHEFSCLGAVCHGQKSIACSKVAMPSRIGCCFKALIEHFEEFSLYLFVRHEYQAKKSLLKAGSRRLLLKDVANLNDVEAFDIFIASSLQWWAKCYLFSRESRKYRWPIGGFSLLPCANCQAGKSPAARPPSQTSLSWPTEGLRRPDSSAWVKQGREQDPLVSPVSNLLLIGLTTLP